MSCKSHQINLRASTKRPNAFEAVKTELNASFAGASLCSESSFRVDAAVGYMKVFCVQYVEIWLAVPENNLKRHRQHFGSAYGLC